MRVAWDTSKDTKSVFVSGPGKEKYWPTNMLFSKMFC